MMTWREEKVGKLSHSAMLTPDRELHRPFTLFDVAHCPHRRSKKRSTTASPEVEDGQVDDATAKKRPKSALYPRKTHRDAKKGLSRGERRKSSSSIARAMNFLGLFSAKEEPIFHSCERRRAEQPRERSIPGLSSSSPLPRECVQPFSCRRKAFPFPLWRSSRSILRDLLMPTKREGKKVQKRRNSLEHFPRKIPV